MVGQIMFSVINIFSGQNSRNMCCNSNTAKKLLSVARVSTIVIAGIQFSEDLLNGFQSLPFCSSLWQVDSKQWQVKGCQDKNKN